MNRWFLDEARKGNVYHSHNTTKGAVTVLDITCTGLVLENPFGSKKDLIVANMTALPTGIATIRELGVAVSTSVQDAASTSTTAAVIHNAKLAGADAEVGVGLVYSIAELSSIPIWLQPLGTTKIDAGTDGVEGYGAFSTDFDGLLVVTPGTYVAFSSLTGATTALCSITWAEDDQITRTR